MSKLELLLLILAILGGIDIAGKGVEKLAAYFPKLSSAQAKLWGFLAQLASIPYLRRKAVATRVEQVLNQTTFSLERYLPKGWVRRSEVKWVRSARPSQLRHGNVVLRIRPSNNSDDNLMQALWVYFGSALFHDSRDRLPKDLLSGVALAVARAGIEKNQSYLLEEFDKKFVQKAGSESLSSLEVFSDCVRLNDYGFLMGPFVREIEHAVTSSALSRSKKGVAEFTAEVMQHMLTFQPLLLLRNKPEQDWRFQSGGHSYAFILVSRPPDVRPAVSAYVKRAQEHVRSGVERLYVIGREEERDFVKAVVVGLLSVRELKGQEWFSLYRDYRGELAGVAALLSVDKLVSDLRLPIRSSLDAVPEREVIGLEQVNDTTDQLASSEQGIRDDLTSIVEELIVQLSDYDGDWIPLAHLGSELRGQVPGFTPQKYGFRNLMSVLKRLGTLEFQERGIGPAKAVYVRMRTDVDEDDSRESPAMRELEEAVTSILETQIGNEGWLFLGQLGHRLKLRIEGFDCLRYGAASLHELVSSMRGVEVQERGLGHSKTYVRARD